MCVWGHCTETDTTQRCKFCGTKFCTACGRGDFLGSADNFDKCYVCQAKNKFMEQVPNPNTRRYTPEHLAELKRIKEETKVSKGSNKSKKANP
ncbi:unnamed protein product [Mesocestoides corti]|uniref:FYVE-type domain-containing protein n=1 Tax=Mesocestoides corti TaxID=53468 RepID=A0A0R3U4S4_MESCO|nr:unnamed protein product [Mesocestoides corti]